MMVTALSSFLFLILVALLLVLALKNILPARRLKLRIHLTWRMSLSLAGLYLGILILLVPVSCLLPRDAFFQPDESGIQADLLGPSPIESLFVDSTPLTGDLANQPGFYRNGFFTFRAEGDNADKLLLQCDPNIYYTANTIFLEKKKSDDGEIEVHSYAGPQLINNMDCTKQILPPAISYKDGILSIAPATQQRLTFIQFNTDFTVRQFQARAEATPNMNSFSTMSGNKIIYIRIPKSMEIDIGPENSDDQIHLLHNE